VREEEKITKINKKATKAYISLCAERPLADRFQQKFGTFGDLINVTNHSEFHTDR
jgi:hypothetical protein